MMAYESTTKTKYEKGIDKKRRRMTTIIGGKCADGVVLIADRKLTYFYRPTEYVEKIHRDYYPVVTSAAGGSNAYVNFRNKLLPALQPEPKPVAWENMKVSGIILMLSDRPEETYEHFRARIGELVKEVNRDEELPDRIQLLVGMQLKDRGALLLQFNDTGYPIEESKYAAIGSGEPYTYVFLKPFYSAGITMQEFAKLGYFTIKYIDKFEIDGASGLDKSGPFDRPQLWFIPNSGQLYNSEERPDLMNWLEGETNRMLDNLEKNGINQFSSSNITGPEVSF